MKHPDHFRWDSFLRVPPDSSDSMMISIEKIDHDSWYSRYHTYQILVRIIIITSKSEKDNFIESLVSMYIMMDLMTG